MERMTVQRADGRWAIANNDGASPAKQLEKFPVAIARLAAYEDTGLEPEEIVRLCSVHERAKMAELLRREENPPLTPEELREMDGEPVWVTLSGEDFIQTHCYAIVDIELECVLSKYSYLKFENYGNGGWTAYRRKPEEETVA